VATISKSCLDFARAHITKYYDSDFYPKAFEFDAIWHGWAPAVAELTSRNISKIHVSAPRFGTSPKAAGGFRVVHQLQPMDTLLYTACAAAVAEDVERARIPIEQHVACSYRFHLNDGSFFSGGAGWRDFVATTQSLSSENPYVLVTDIIDFYNQISLHRLNNAIELANPALKPLADDIEHFIGTLNAAPSKGVPVGPAASVVMSEAVLNDIDRFIINQGFPHTRYVDDFHVFGTSRAQLNVLLDSLTSYLYSNHRLTLSSEKTRILSSKEFLERKLHNPYAEIKAEVLETLEIFNPYVDEPDEDVNTEDNSGVELSAALTNAFAQMAEFPLLDLGLARSVLRHARRSKVVDLAPLVLQQFSFLSPVMNDVVLYLNEVSNPALRNELQPLLRDVLSCEAVNNRLVRYWLEWYVCQHESHLADHAIRTFVAGSQNIENQALAAITTRNVQWVREKKPDVLGMADWARRAIFNAARVLPSDEREHWLKMCRANSPILLDRLVATWVIETA
jgi:reverse transcriptase-like protein